MSRPRRGPNDQGPNDQPPTIEVNASMVSEVESDKPDDNNDDNSEPATPPTLGSERTSRRGGPGGARLWQHLAHSHT